MELFGLLVIGFFIGISHAMEADHLAAVASINQSGRGLKFLLHRGIVWGVGHGFALLVICGLFVLLGGNLNHVIEAWLELLVAIMIIGLGANTVHKMLRRRIHFHLHQHDGHTHFHAHSHQDQHQDHNQAKHQQHQHQQHQHQHDQHQHQHSRGHWLALAIGLLHGAAGSGALLVIVVAATHSIAEAFLYITIFAVGAIVGMAILSMIISLPLSIAELQARRLNKMVLIALAGFCFWTGGQLGFDSLMLLGLINI